MGWVTITNLKTGETKLLGKPELMKSQPPEELGERVYSEWLKEHPTRRKEDVSEQ